MLLALVRRILLFVSFLLVTSFALVFVHALAEEGAISWPAGVGAGAAAIVLALCWVGMVKNDDYLTPSHTRAFFLVTGVLTGLIGTTLFGYFTFSDQNPSSYLLYFGIAPAGVAALFIVVAIIRFKEAYSLPSEYRAEQFPFQWGILPVMISLPALLVSAVALGLTVKELVIATGHFRASFPENSAETEILDDVARRIRAGETFQLAKRQQQLDHYRGAFDLFQKAAELGHVEADYELALIYSGDGYLRNLELARKHLQTAAAAGHTEAAYRLGKAYRHGELGLERDYARARENLEVAAASGHLDAQTQLGHLYNRGQGVEVSHEKAFHWFLRAAEQGDAIAQNDVGIFYLHGTGVEADPEKGFHWLTLAADQGVAVAQYNLGRALYAGKAVPQDYDRAFTYFQGLAEKNIPYGFQMVGLQYLYGHGPAKDTAAAFAAFTEGAARGDTVSEYYLGYCYLNGLGTEKNSSAALHYLTTAATKDNVEAQLLLGQIHLAGAAILQDKAEAAKWFSLAAAAGSEEAAAEWAKLEPNLTAEELSDVAERVDLFRRVRGQ